MSPEDFISQLKYRFIEIHKGCREHETVVQQSFLCGCFYCISTFYPTEIKDWDSYTYEGEERTAACPKCGIDAVIPSSENYEINDELLEAMRLFYFNR